MPHAREKAANESTDQPAARENAAHRLDGNADFIIFGVVTTLYPSESPAEPLRIRFCASGLYVAPATKKQPAPMLLFAHINLTLPLEDPILKFLLILVIILAAPLLLNKLKIPYLLGLIIAGAVFLL